MRLTNRRPEMRTMPMSQVAGRMSAHAGANALEKAQGGRGVIPGKIFEYLAARRPILALITEGAAARVIRDTGAGYVVSPHDVEGTANALEDLFTRWQRDPQSLLIEGRGIARYNRKNLTASLAKILTDVSNA